jgi:CheY-like chemotaxis protein
MPYSRVLLIDDDEDDHDIFLSAMNEISSITHCSAENGSLMALQKLENREIIPDVIFLDVNMPIMDGQEFLKQIKQRDALKGIPVIML